MKIGPNIAKVAALLGDQARAEVLTTLMSGRALTATELADAAGVTKQTMSSHLSRLVDAGLLAVEPQGRHRYFRIADDDVAHFLESMMGIAFRTGAVRLNNSPREPALRRARICYDHLAGEIGVSIYDRLCERRFLTPGGDGLELTADGACFFLGLGIDTETLRRQRRTFCRHCLDWSERRHHLAGALGASLLTHIIGAGWARLDRDSRVLRFTAVGERALLALLLPT